MVKSKGQLSEEMALRIALAAREIPDFHVARLLAILDELTGLPPAKPKLDKLKVKDLKAALDGELANVDTAILKSVLAYLKGENALMDQSLPGIEPYEEGDMPGSIRVACASNDADNVNGHFGSCRRFLVYQVSADEYRLIDIRDTGGDEESEDKNAYRAALIADCQIVFLASIGGPAAAKVVRAGVHPLKKPNAGSAAEEITALQGVIGPSAPPWLAKVMGQSPEERIRFDQDASA